MVGTGVLHREVVSALSDAAQQRGKIGQMVGDDVDHLAFPLQFAATGQHAGGQHEAALTVEHRGPDDEIGMTGLVLDGDEQHAAGTAGTLAYQHDAGNRQTLTVARGG